MSEQPDLTAAAEAAARAVAESHRLETIVNPSPRIDYLILLEGTLAASGATVRLIYVPDRLLLPEDGFVQYLAHLDQGAPDRGLPEELALKILGDLNDELVPRWLQIHVAGAPSTPARSGNGGAHTPHRHCALVEDRQPKWDNKALLARARGL
jgi:hypothetical protein